MIAIPEFLGLSNTTLWTNAAKEANAKGLRKTANSGETDKHVVVKFMNLNARVTVTQHHV